MLAVINTEKLKAKPSEYRAQAHEKRLVVLHYTAGYNAQSAVNTWRRTSWRDGTAYVIDTDGTIYQFFDPRYWAVHIYRHKKREPRLLYDIERSSIGIELANIGPLKLGKEAHDKDVLYTYTGKPYCRLSETHKYVQQTWKNWHYWATYTDGQYQALRVLLRDIESAFQIPHRASPLGGRIDVWPAEKIGGYRGVVTHCNFRRDKMDVGPAFDWASAGLIP